MGEPYGHRPYEHKDYDASSSDLFSESSSRERGEQTPAEYSGSEEMVGCDEAHASLSVLEHLALVMLRNTRC